MAKRLRLDPASRITGGERMVRFPVGLFPLREELTRLLVTKGFIRQAVPLEELHLHLPADAQKVDVDLLNAVTKSFYETSDVFRAHYRGLIAYLSKSAFDFDFIFQTTPTIRFHFPVRLPEGFRGADGEYLGQHNDGMLGHSFEEINLWMPLTESRGSAGLQLANLDDSLDILNDFAAGFGHDQDTYHSSGRTLFYQKLVEDLGFQRKVVAACIPRDIRYGDIVAFDSRALHGPAENRESFTRISLDFRIMPLDVYESLDGEFVSKGRSKRKFIRGDVFDAATAREAASALGERQVETT